MGVVGKVRYNLQKSQNLIGQSPKHIVDEKV